MPSRADTDVLVVGGSVAGSATAVGVARAGLSVTVLDRVAFPREKPCGEGVMPGGARELQRLGVMPELLRRGARPLEGIVYHQGGAKAEGRFPDGHTGLCVRRLELDEVMAQLCVRHGVERLEDARVVGVEKTAAGWRVHARDGRTFQARFLVGADGRGSVVRRHLGLDGARAGPLRFGVRQHFRVARPRTDGLVHVHLCGTHEVYITPQADGCINVALLLGKESSPLLGGDLEQGYRSIIHAVPDVAALLADAQPVTGALACGPLRVTAAGVVADAALLVGDASGYVDAITGEGVSLALAQAAAAVPVITRAVREGRSTPRDLQPYVSAHRALGRDHARMTELVLYAASRPWLMARVVAALGRRPDLFGRLLAANDGRESLVRAAFHVGPGLLLGAALG